MSRDVLTVAQTVRSPGGTRRLAELPTVDKSPSREFFKKEGTSVIE